MKLSRRFNPLFVCMFGLCLGACGPSGVQGSSSVAELSLSGTIYTIVLENHGAGVLSDMPYAESLAKRYASASSYYADHHPSLPNYLILTSGTDQDVTDDNGPDQHPIAGTDNLADQLDAAKIPWRAYMEDMGQPCVMHDVNAYSVHHNPFVYYTSLSSDSARCEEHDVDMATNFAPDLKSNQYQFMWITPNKCHDMHDCDPSAADQWLQQIVPQIQASDGYKAGGAIFIIWDEGGPDGTYVFGGKQTIPFILVSDHVVSDGFTSDVLYSHDSFVATVEDFFGIPRLPTTKSSAPMTDLFAQPTQKMNGGAGGSGSTGR